MALTQKQINELNIASQRIASGSPGAKDVANVNYATQKLGYTYTPPTSLPSGMTQLTSPSQVSQYNIAGQVGVTGTSGSYLYGTPKTITAEGMQTATTPVNVGTPTPNTTAATAATAGAEATTKTLQDYITKSTPPSTPESQKADALTAEIEKLLGETAGQTQALSTEEANRNVPQLQQQLTGINSQIQSGLAEYKQLQAQYEATSVANRGQVVPMSKIIGNEAQIQYAKASALNMKAADIGLLQAQALGLQGQIEAAQVAAKKAVDLKYAPILEQLTIKQQQLALIESILNKQEKIQAAALQMQYENQKQAVADQKEADNNRIGLALHYMQTNPDAGITMQDSYATMQAKVSSSASYKQSQATSSSLPTSLQEYEFAVAQGYKGDFMAYKNDVGAANSQFRVLTPAEAQTLGVPYGSTAGDAYGTTPTKPLTEAQSKDLTYAARASDSQTTLNNLAQTIANYNSVQFALEKTAEAYDISSPYVSDTIRQLRQAERNFSTAVLRRESGASISASEFSTMEKQYFPRPGDDATTLAQKAQNRETAIKSFQASNPTQSTTTSNDWNW